MEPSGVIDLRILPGSSFPHLMSCTMHEGADFYLNVYGASEN